MIARSQLLAEQPSASAKKGEIHVDEGLEEAIRSIIYAAPRTEIRELHQSRNLLAEKFGKDFLMETMEGTGVADRVKEKLKVQTPKRELVDNYLRIIAEGYNVPLPEGLRRPEDDVPPPTDDDDDDQPGSGGLKNKALEAPLEAEELNKATPPKSVGVSSPVRIVPQSPTTENPVAKIKLPGTSDSVRDKKPPAPAGKAPGGKVPNADDDLLKRLAALKGA